MRTRLLEGFETLEPEVDARPLPGPADLTRQIPDTEPQAP